MEEEELKYDKYGFQIDEESRVYPEFPERKQFSVEHKWRDLLEDWEDKVIHQPERINSRVYKGVPHSMRSQVWKTMLDLKEFVSTQPEGYYNSLISQEGKKEHEEQIWLDIPRTFPDHVTLSTPQGRDALFKVLKAYSLYNPGVGYCQGMSYVAAVFLMFMSQEDAFWMLRIVLTRDHLEGFYNPCMSKLIENSHIFERMFELHLPLLSKHLTSSKIDPLLYVTPWWMCTFTGLPNWDLVMRIWDCFLWEGANATYRFALAILQLMEDDLLAVDGAEGLLPILLRPDINKFGQDALFKIAMDIPVHDLLLEVETPREPQVTTSTTTTPTKSPRKRKAAEPTKSSSFLGKIFKSFTPGATLRKRNKESNNASVQATAEKPKPRTPQSSSRRRRKSLNKSGSKRTSTAASPHTTSKSETSFMRKLETPPSSPPPYNFNSPTCVPLLSSLPTSPITPSTSSLISTPTSHSAISRAIYKTPSPARVRTVRTPKSSGKKTSNKKNSVGKRLNMNNDLLGTPTALSSPIRKININSPALKLDFDTPSTRRPLLLNNENAGNLQDCFSPPDATYEQKQFVKEFSTPTPSKGRVRFALGEITPLKIDNLDEKNLKTPSKYDEDYSGEEMVEIKRATKRRRKGFTGVPVFEY